jgi:hypothetical protein
LPALAKKPALKNKAKRELQIVRDVTFARAVADKVMVINLGRDIEFAFLQHGQNLALSEVEDRDGVTFERIAMEPVLTEVVRVRISPEGALQTAMQILDRLISSQQIVSEAVLEAIQEMTKKASSGVSES